MANQGNPAGPAAQQQQQQQPRMMRPVMANNPGLRHLLQQVLIDMLVYWRSHLTKTNFDFLAATTIQADDGNAGNGR